MISEKLLSAVLEKEILSVEIKDNLVVWVALDSAGAINIYELAYKCKVWSLIQGFEITEEFDRVRVISLDKSRYIQDYNSNNYNPNKIFKACESILKYAVPIIIHQDV